MGPPEKRNNMGLLSGLTLKNKYSHLTTCDFSFLQGFLKVCYWRLACDYNMGVFSDQLNSEKQKTSGRILNGICGSISVTEALSIPLFTYNKLF